MDRQSGAGDPPDAFSRHSICLPDYGTMKIVHEGQHGFRDELQRHFPTAEIESGKDLFELKAKLRTAETEDFWQILLEGMTKIAEAQYAFVCKRILQDDDESAVEMPPVYLPGPCYLALAFYFNDGHGTSQSMRNVQYEALEGPCSHMRHNKVLIIPERFQEVIPLSSTVMLPFVAEAYFALPLFSEGRCFGHFGMMWSVEGIKRRKHSWGYIELLMHALEDLVSDRILSRRSFTSKDLQVNAREVIPHEAITMNQSLKPYARSLSHELRTPMQGVVGMLDVMHATVQEEVEGQTNNKVRRVFQNLKENIEIVQDSSRRAVEAADNVVHAYDLNMQVPETPVSPTDGAVEEKSKPDVNAPISKGKRPSIVVEGHDLSMQRPNKRRRSAASTEWYYGSHAKHQAVESSESPPSTEPASPRSSGLTGTIRERDEMMSVEQFGLRDGLANHTTSSQFEDTRETSGGIVGHSRLRDLLHLIVNESLTVGGRPDSAVAIDTQLGESIEVRSRDSRGDTKVKTIDIVVDPSVPETLQVDERDLTKLISCVFLNALKFTESGNITVTATLSSKARYVSLTVTDTGPGIPQTFVPFLFKPFSREDDSTTRQKDGLGLGLLVAKGLARKIGGDLHCLRSDTSGPNRGSVFEIRIPVTPLDAGSMSMPGTPRHRTPTPSSSSASRQSPDLDGHPWLAEIPRSVPLKTIGTSQSIPGRLRGRLSLGTAVGALSISPPPCSDPSQCPVSNGSPTRRSTVSRRRATKAKEFDRKLADKYPITFLVAEDNRLNRKLLVNMLSKMGYKDVHEAYDGAEAVRQMEVEREKPIDVVLMDLWMPYIDGYEAAQRILAMPKYCKDNGTKSVTILAVTADVTGEALERAAQVGMEGFMTKPYKLLDLERLILEYCARKTSIEE